MNQLATPEVLTAEPASSCSHASGTNVGLMERTSVSEKSDRDNHSNQLNPNNEAYSSSRAGNASEDDEDPSWTSTARSPASYLNAIHQQQFRNQAPQPVYERFLIDFLSLDGHRSCLEVTAVLPYRNFFNGYVRDCTDMVECIWLKLSLTFAETAGSPVAWSQVRGANGKPLVWLGGHYSPCPPSDHTKHEDRAARIKHNALWELQGKSMIAAFQACLADETAIKRENLGNLTPDAAVKIRRGY